MFAASMIGAQNAHLEQGLARLDPLWGYQYQDSGF